MRIGIPKETAAGEARVALVPETVAKLVTAGFEVLAERGAGESASFPDAQYTAAGATLVDAATALGADIVTKVRTPSAAETGQLQRGSLLVGFLSPLTDKEGVAALQGAGVTAFALESIPRISRAQSMDALSSQSTVAGYKSVLVAADTLPKFFPMLITAAGTVAPAKVLVLGAGVAGLQAIATARRLGAIVSATDVRKATEEQVKSLGAKFVYADIADAATSGGYAKELTAEDKAKQAALVAAHVKTQDVIITTALIPGRPAPVLITQEMVESMKPGSIIVDLAVERGGNCPLSKPDQIVEHNGVKIVGTVNLAGKLAGNAAPLFAKNLANFLDLMIQKDGTLKIDDADECVKGTMIATDGALVHPMFGAK